MYVWGAEEGMKVVAAQKAKMWQRQAKTCLQTFVQVILNCSSCFSVNDINIASFRECFFLAERFISGNGKLTRFHSASGQDSHTNLYCDVLFQDSFQRTNFCLHFAYNTYMVFRWATTLLACCMKPGRVNTCELGFVISVIWILWSFSGLFKCLVLQLLNVHAHTK